MYTGDWNALSEFALESYHKVQSRDGRLGSAGELCSTIRGPVPEELQTAGRGVWDPWQAVLTGEPSRIMIHRYTACIPAAWHTQYTIKIQMAISNFPVQLGGWWEAAYDEVEAWARLSILQHMIGGGKWHLPSAHTQPNQQRQKSEYGVTDL